MYHVNNSFNLVIPMTHPTRSLSPNTSSKLDLVTEYLISEGWGDHANTEDNNEFGHNTGGGLIPPGNAPVLQNTHTRHAQALDQLDAELMGLGAVTPNRMWQQPSPSSSQPATLQRTPPPSLDASPPYGFPSLEAAGGREQSPSLFPQAEGYSLDGADWQHNLFSNTLTPVEKSYGSSDSLVSDFDRVVIEDPSHTSEKSRRGAPHRHRRQFLEGKEKLRRKRELNNEASHIYRVNKRASKEQRLSECQRLEQTNQQLQERCRQLEKEAQMCREVYPVVEPYLRLHGYEPCLPATRDPTLPLLPDAHHNLASRLHQRM